MRAFSCGWFNEDDDSAARTIRRAPDTSAPCTVRRTREDAGGGYWSAQQIRETNPSVRVARA
jgi:hypothetical protein